MPIGEPDRGRQHLAPLSHFELLAHFSAEHIIEQLPRGEDGSEKVEIGL